MYIAGRVKHMELNQNTEKLDNYRKRAAELVGKMTLEEKVAQTLYQAPAVERLNIKAYNWWNEALHGQSLTCSRRERIRISIKA